MPQPGMGDGVKALTSFSVGEEVWGGHLPFSRDRRTSAYSAYTLTVHVKSTDFEDGRGVIENEYVKLSDVIERVSKMYQCGECHNEFSSVCSKLTKAVLATSREELDAVIKEYLHLHVYLSDDSTLPMYDLADCGIEVYIKWLKGTGVETLPRYLSIIVLAYRDVRRMELEDQKKKETWSRGGKLLVAKGLEPIEKLPGVAQPAFWIFNEPPDGQMPNAKFFQGDYDSAKDCVYMSIVALSNIQRGDWLSIFYGRPYVRSYHFPEDHLAKCEAYDNAFVLHKEKLYKA